MANEEKKTCGSCSAGIVVSDGVTIQRCDECKLFETDEDAAHAVVTLLAQLAIVYEGNPKDTVADALDRIVNVIAPPTKVGGNDNPALCVAAAQRHLLTARDYLKRAGAPKSLERVKLALSSVRGALGNAEMREHAARDGRARKRVKRAPKMRVTTNNDFPFRFDATGREE